MNYIYQYDGTFEGLLTAIFDAYYLDVKPSRIVSAEQFSPSFFDSIIPIYTDQNKSEKVAQAILKKLKNDVFQTVLYAYFSEDEDAGMLIYKFLKVAFKIGPKCLEYRAHEHIGPVLDLYRSVARESHLLLGVIRFMELKSGIFYSQFESSYNILHILGGHFYNRLSGEQWVLHDMKRGVAAFCDGKEWHVRPVDIPDNIELNDRELLFQTLWQTYFKHVAIVERSNYKVQRAHMPKKYWKYLIEKPGVTSYRSGQV